MQQRADVAKRKKKIAFRHNNVIRYPFPTSSSGTRHTNVTAALDFSPHFRISISHLSVPSQRPNERGTFSVTSTRTNPYSCTATRIDSPRITLDKRGKRSTQRGTSLVSRSLTGSRHKNTEIHGLPEAPCTEKLGGRLYRDRAVIDVCAIHCSEAIKALVRGACSRYNFSVLHHNYSMAIYYVLLLVAH